MASYKCPNCDRSATFDIDSPPSHCPQCGVMMVETGDAMPVYQCPACQRSSAMPVEKPIRCSQCDVLMLKIGYAYTSSTMGWGCLMPLLALIAAFMVLIGFQRWLVK